MKPDPARFVIFRLGAWRCALPLESVREVVVPAHLSRVPRAPPPIRGVMNLRGRVVTVVDLGRLLGGAPVEGLAQKLLVLDGGRRDLGVLVSQVYSIATLGEELDLAGDAPGPAMARREAEGGPVLVLDADRCEKRLIEEMERP